MHNVLFAHLRKHATCTYGSVRILNARSVLRAELRTHPHVRTTMWCSRWLRNSTSEGSDFVRPFAKTVCCFEICESFVIVARCVRIFSHLRGKLASSSPPLRTHPLCSRGNEAESFCVRCWASTKSRRVQATCGSGSSRHGSDIEELVLGRILVATVVVGFDFPTVCAGGNVPSP